jgi:hypothetical protein
LVVSFDTYDNGGGEAPAMDVRFAGQAVASTKVPVAKILTAGTYVDVAIRVEPDGTFDLVYNGEVVYFNLPLPGFAPIAGSRFGFGGRTGGLNANHWIDDLMIATDTRAPNPVISGVRLAQGNIVIEWSGGGSLQSAADVTGPWATVSNPANPYSAAASGPRRFYRVSSGVSP